MAIATAVAAHSTSINDAECVPRPFGVCVCELLSLPVRNRRNFTHRLFALRQYLLSLRAPGPNRALLAAGSTTYTLDRFLARLCAPSSAPMKARERLLLLLVVGEWSALSLNTCC